LGQARGDPGPADGGEQPVGGAGVEFGHARDGQDERRDVAEAADGGQQRRGPGLDRLPDRIDGDSLGKRPPPQRGRQGDGRADDEDEREESGRQPDGGVHRDPAEFPPGAKVRGWSDPVGTDRFGPPAEEFRGETAVTFGDPFHDAAEEPAQRNPDHDHGQPLGEEHPADQRPPGERAEMARGQVPQASPDPARGWYSRFPPWETIADPDTRKCFHRSFRLPTTAPEKSTEHGLTAYGTVTTIMQTVTSDDK